MSMIDYFGNTHNECTLHEELLNVESHLQSYGITNNLYYTWNIGFSLTILILTQVITGILLTAHYIPNTQYAFTTITYINRDLNKGWYLHYNHTNIVSLLMAFIYLHITRALYVNSYKLNASIWTSGILIIFTAISTVFIGYVLTWGQISFWGITVIKNIISHLPSAIHSLTGNLAIICNQTLIRLSTIHF